MCKGELLEFTETLKHEFENRTIFEAWRICGSNLKWHINWPKLMQLWQIVILVPSSIAICEREFPKQNAIKSHLRNRLNSKTFDALMQVSLCGLEVDAMDRATYHLQHLEKHVRPKNTYTRLIVILLQIKIIFS